jgi:hypothetical protein
MRGLWSRRGGPREPGRVRPAEPPGEPHTQSSHARAARQEVSRGKSGASPSANDVPPRTERAQSRTGPPSLWAGGGTPRLGLGGGGGGALSNACLSYCDDDGPRAGVRAPRSRTRAADRLRPAPVSTDRCPHRADRHRRPCRLDGPPWMHRQQVFGLRPHGSVCIASPSLRSGSGSAGPRSARLDGPRRCSRSLRSRSALALAPLVLTVRHGLRPATATTAARRPPRPGRDAGTSLGPVPAGRAPHPSPQVQGTTPPAGATRARPHAGPSYPRVRSWPPGQSRALAIRSASSGPVLPSRRSSRYALPGALHGPPRAGEVVAAVLAGLAWLPGGPPSAGLGRGAGLPRSAPWGVVYPFPRARAMSWRLDAMSAAPDRSGPCPRPSGPVPLPIFWRSGDFWRIVFSLSSLARQMLLS